MVLHDARTTASIVTRYSAALFVCVYHTDPWMWTNSCSSNSLFSSSPLHHPTRRAHSFIRPPSPKKGQIGGRDSEDIQHQQRLLAGRVGGSATLRGSVLIYRTLIGGGGVRGAGRRREREMTRRRTSGSAGRRDGPGGSRRPEHERRGVIVRTHAGVEDSNLR